MPEPLIAVDARSVRPGMTGVGRFAGQMLRAATRREAGFRWGLFTDVPDFLTRWLQRDSAIRGEGRQLPPGVEIWAVGASPESHPRTEWWLSVALPRDLRQRGAALFHGPAFAVPWRRIPLPTVLTVPDLAHRLRPPTQPWRFRRWLRWSIARGVRVADRVVVFTPAVAHELGEVHPAVRDRLDVIPGGVAPEMCAPPAAVVAAFRERHGLPDRYLLHVGTFEPRKNHGFLLEVHGALCAEMDDPPALVMAGTPGPTLGRVRRWLDASPWRDRQVIRCGAEGFDDADMPALLSGAEALLFPSLCEGFGLPVLEALACGTPVFAALVPGLDFFSRSPAVLLPLGAPRPWVEAIQSLLGKPDAREVAHRAGPEWARHLTWDAAADRFLDLCRELLRA